MIKNLRFKFVLVFLILVVSVFITSSCYALTYKTEVKDDNLLEVAKSHLLIDLDNLDYRVFTLYDSYYDSYQYFFVFGGDDSSAGLFDNTYVKLRIENSQRKLGIYSSEGVLLNFYYQKVNITSTGVLNQVYPTTVELSNALTFDGSNSSKTYYVCSSSQFDYYVDDELIFDVPDSISLDFDYTIVGTKRGQVKLSISGLDSSLNMFGYVDCENLFEIGDVLDTSLIADSLRMTSILIDRSDLDCYLYDGEKLLYYIVDENNIILDIGYITEMCEGYYLYGFPVSDGIDFVFLNNGVPYWNNDLTFKYQVNNGKLFTKNEVVSSGSYIYIETDKTVYNKTYRGFVYDSNGSEIASASIIAINDLSNIRVESLATRYREFSTGWFSGTTCVYELYNLTLAGTNMDGSYIDFGDYYVRWSIEPYTTLLESVKIDNSDYGKYYGTVSGFDSDYGILKFELEIHQLLEKRVSSFEIVFEIYDGNDNLVLKHVVNSDDIVKQQIINNEYLPDKPSYDITGNPNYSGGNYPNSDNIQNWDVDDFVSFLGTDNGVFNFFWAFLNNMPSWISTPLSILLIGLVVITLYKFIRG